MSSHAHSLATVKNYYLVCIKDGKEGLSYYRIDLMQNIAITDKKLAVARSAVNLDSVRKLVYAFSGEPEHRLCFS